MLRYAGLLCLQITCVWCKERVEVPERPQGEKLNYLHVLKEISHNKALLGVMFFSLTGMIGASVVNGLNTYLYKDFFGNVKIQAVSGMLSVLYAVLSFAITQPLANKFGKKEWCCMGAGFAAIVFGILFFFPVHNPVVFIVINGICYLGASGMQVLIWAMVNDAIDYHELQTGERNEGIRLLHLLLLPQACKRHFRQPVQLCAGCHRLQRDRRRCADRRRCERHLEELHRRLLPGLRHCSCILFFVYP